VASKASCIPIRGRYPALEVLLVTAREAGDWVAPKGRIDKGESAEDAARREAEEEAGVRGRIVRRLGSFGHAQEAFLLEVTSELDWWPEQLERDRRWFGLGEALRAVRRPRMRAMLESLLA